MQSRTYNCNELRSQHIGERVTLAGWYENPNSTGTMLLLRVQLIEYHDKYMKLGSIPSYAYENFVEMYQAYHELGGNGMVTTIW